MATIECLGCRASRLPQNEVLATSPEQRREAPALLRRRDLATKPQALALKHRPPPKKLSLRRDEGRLGRCNGQETAFGPKSV